ncbi:hypothetical protein MOK15_07445 [Sphingobium sp. BYY-5]|uniref:hypothetical protein n=1 Tax=Sphingobium sp. BYY-5 TaxID=2926400 RepID=UPI001FA6B9B0|nr:hypothetical protein [Sphingobium sp. BYY-5]MCI4589924.1 hypothetical protein [Sphingobium sp. BYY-5]
MIAPPQVQAHNLANAIRTDIGSTLILLPLIQPSMDEDGGYRELPMRMNAKERVNRNVVNPDSIPQVEANPASSSMDMVNVPLWNAWADCRAGLRQLVAVHQLAAKSSK